MSETVLETTQLTKNFRGRRAVDNLSLQVLEGDVYGFLGPNGAGKSTTIRMLTDLVRPSFGSAKLMGRNVFSHRVEALKDVGALVESPTFYKFMSARENLRIFGRLSGGCDEKRIDEVLDMVGLLDRANDKVKSYSHGMCQRLGIAQALLPRPRLVILDEPTSGLDPQGMRDVRDLIRRLAKEEKVTIFLSSHLLHEVEQVCNRVGIINHGRLLAEGNVSELLQTEIEVVEFRVDDADRALEVLRRIDWVELLPSEAASIVVRVAPRLVPEINRALVAADVDVRAVIPRSASLEDLFLELVEEGQDAG